MSGSAWVDLVVIAIALLAAASGFRQGAVASALAFVGVVLGAVAGILLAPHLIDHIGDRRWRLVVGVGLLVELVVIGEASGMILGWGGAMLVTAGRELRRSLLIWLAQIAVISLLPGISWAGHLGGFLFGLPMGLALRSGPRAFSRAAPLLLAIAAGVTYITAHLERFGGSP